MYTYLRSSIFDLRSSVFDLRYRHRHEGEHEVEEHRENGGRGACATNNNNNNNNSIQFHEYLHVIWIRYDIFYYSVFVYNSISIFREDGGRGAWNIHMEYMDNLEIT